VAIEPVDAYAVLGVAPTASFQEIRHAYRSLARGLHPDANPGDREAVARFRMLAHAYEQVGDPLRRLAYDRVHHPMPSVGPRAARTAPGPTGNTAVRDVGARPDHRPREAAAEAPPVDRTSFRAVAWILGAAVGLMLTLVLTFVVSALITDDDPLLSVPSPRPGVAGFCHTADGWVACVNVHENP
jgi:hypothetical protein